MIAPAQPGRSYFNLGSAGEPVVLGAGHALCTARLAVMPAHAKGD